ncbi:MAG: HAMP domain-containing sensor histidine kinase [Acidimicrobiia bacterium]
MTIKARLTIAVVLLLLVLTAVLGIFTVRSTRSSMIGQLDDRLVAIRDRPGPPIRQEPALLGSVRYRDLAEFLYSRRGELLDSRPAGFSDDPEPGPALPAFSSAAFDALLDRVVTLPSTDRSLEYRVLVFRPRDGSVKVIAQTLTNVNEAVSSLTQTFVIAGLAMVVIGGIVSWVIIRRSLRPVEGMIDTAAAIASGDLTQRVDHDEDGTELGRLADALDEMLGQLEAAFGERVAAQERLEQFVADASHELRTPVTAIRGYAELYRGGGIAEGEQLDRAMRRIEQESSRMATLVEDLLLLARLDEQQPLAREPVDLTALAEDAVSDLRAIDRERPVTLEATDRAIVLGDEGRLRQVLANLLTNARVHTPPHVPVHVTVDREHDRVRLVVADEGPGIDEADRRRIFERFSRADPSRSRERGGFGLGLSIVAAVVAAHHGSIEVTTVADGGAAFAVDLPSAPIPTAATTII